MKVVHDLPPMWPEIATKFKLSPVDRVIYAWGDTIYNPAGITIPLSLMVHEAVHGARQGFGKASIETWWHNYINNASFRLLEEIPAHIAEYLEALRHVNNRHERRHLEKVIAARLAGPLYGNLISLSEARQILRVRNPK